MQIIFSESADTAENAAVLVAFSALALACKATQVCGMLVVGAAIANVAAPALIQKQCVDNSMRPVS